MGILRKTIFGLVAGASSVLTLASALEIDNSSLGKPEFREHKATYGLVYLLPGKTISVLDAKLHESLQDSLLKLGLDAEARMFNLPHISVFHLHNADPVTPQKILQSLPGIPPVLNITLQGFGTTEAARGAEYPWWLDMRIVKSGQGFEDLMAYNTVAAAALAPLRDGPLPRCTGPVFASMSDSDRELTRTMGANGLNIVRDGREIRAHNPHHTLVYSMSKFDAKMQKGMQQLAGDLREILPEGIPVTLAAVSIVEIGFAGNVVRELYRISLETGVAIDVTTGRVVMVLPR